MELPASIPMHPIDLLYGSTLPQLQPYIVAGPAVDVDEDALRARLRELLPRQYQRMCYRHADHLFAGKLLHRVDDLLAPLHVVDETSFRQLTPAQMRDVGDRHWALYVVRGAKVVTLVFMVGHWLATGMKARRLVVDVLDGFYPDKPPLEPPPMTDAQRAEFQALLAHLTERYRLEHGFAEYRRVTFDAARVRALARRLGDNFTEGVALWLARTIHDVARRDRPMDIVAFRMDLPPGVDGATLNDPAYANEGLVVELWEMLPDGFYAAVDPASGLGSQKAAEFVDFYRRFPLKGPLVQLIDWSIRRQKRKHQTSGADAGGGRERLVVNNLGPDDHAFHRTMFFDPFNDQSSFGLVFVDTSQGTLTLQCAPPTRYLEWFDWAEFEARLGDNLESMLEDARIESRDG